MLGASGAVLEFVQTNGGSIRMKRAFAQWLAGALLAVSPLLDILRAVLNRNNKHLDRSNHGDHRASRGKAITVAVPVFPVPPWLNLYT